MATFLRVISNDTWESLVEKEAPKEIQSKNEKLLSQIPITLHPAVDKLLPFIEWNDKLELIYSEQTIKNSNVRNLATKYVLKSKSFPYLKGSDQFVKSVERKLSKINTKLEPKREPKTKVDDKPKVKWVSYQDFQKSDDGSKIH